MASGPMQTCCISAVLHEGTPQGKVQTIRSNIKTYISHPPDRSTRYAIIILTDVYGYTFPNARLIADHFAAHGYLVLIPDLFNGAEVPFPPPSEFNLQTYIATQMPRPDAVDPIVAATTAYLREDVGVQKIGGVGYCFGGKYVCRHAKSGGLDAGYVAHQSFVDEEEVQGVEVPLSIAAAQIDGIFTTEQRHKTEQILSKNSAPWQIFVYSDTEHGFAVKGHMSTEKARFAKEEAFGQAVRWFDMWIKKGSEA